MDALCVIAAPGAGTEHLCEALGKSPDLAPYPGLFDSGRVGGIAPEAWPLLRRLTGIGFADPSDPRLLEFVHERPAAWLDVLEIAARDEGRRVVALSLFEGQLPLDLIERDIMPRRGLRVVLVVRRQIDSFVAWRKTAALAQLPDAGKMGVRLKLNPDEFCTWMDTQERWYGHWRDTLKRRFLPCPVLRYESDIEWQPAEAVLRRFAAAAAQVGITIRPSAVTAWEAAQPPRARSVADDVRNWIDFSRELFRRGLEKRAFGYPIQ